MGKSEIVKLRNYFSDRIEKIKDGSYAPTYEQIKGLPEFSDINKSNFRIARKKWYKQHFRMSPGKFSARVRLIKAGYTSENKFAARLENIKGEYIFKKGYEKEQIKKKRNIGFCILVVGVLFIVSALFQGAGMGWNPSYVGGYFRYVTIFMGIGIIILVIGFSLVLYYRSKLSK